VEVAGRPTLNAICNCDNCRRRTGSAFGWSIYVTDPQLLSTEGPLQAYVLPIEKVQTRWYCGACGTTLLWKTAWREGETGIAGGCFETLPPAPTFSAVNERRVPWIELHGV
jgi:hypothetical protein